MATFVRLVKMTDQGLRNAKNMGELLAEAGKALGACNAKLVSAYATLGHYDLVAIVEAPDAAAMGKASALVAAQGNFRAETLAAVPIQEFASAVKG